MIYNKILVFKSATISKAYNEHKFCHFFKKFYVIFHDFLFDLIHILQAVDYPIASTPFSRYDPNGVEYNNIVSPISRPKSAPLIMDENEISPSKQGTPMALYASLSQSGHFQGKYLSISQSLYPILTYL